MLDRATVDELLTTTRSVRKRLDYSRTVEPAVLEECLQLALQAPSGSDSQRWHFLMITEPALKQQIADYYRQSFDQAYGAARANPQGGVVNSAIYLADTMAQVPVLVICCYEGRVEQGSLMSQASLYGSILPAAWSFMLALRSRGLGTAWTTLHLRYEQEVAKLLGLPPKITQAVLFPVAYYTGDSFKPAQRRDLHNVTHWNGWGKQREA